nr:MAG TPA: hypothetical protein [Caudoviricetes sp.]
MFGLENWYKHSPNRRYTYNIKIKGESLCLNFCPITGSY